MSKFFGRSFDRYIETLHARWCVAWIEFSQARNICMLGWPTPLQVPHDVSLFYVNASYFQTQDHKETYICGDPGRLPLPDCMFDLVVSLHAHEGGQSGIQVLSESARIVRSQGELLVFSFQPWRVLDLQLRLGQLNQPIQKPWLSHRMIESVMCQSNMQLVHKINLLYRPYCQDKLFQWLSMAEILGPLMMPFGSNMQLTVWRKDEETVILDEAQCQLWS